MSKAKQTVKAPAHLKGIQAFMDTFNVSRDTVRQWARDGAPIFMVGRRYQASYPRLCLWLERQYRAGEQPGAKKPVNRPDTGRTPTGHRPDAAGPQTGMVW